MRRRRESRKCRSSARPTRSDGHNAMASPTGAYKRCAADLPGHKASPKKTSSTTSMACSTVPTIASALPTTSAKPSPASPSWSVPKSSSPSARRAAGWRNSTFTMRTMPTRQRGWKWTKGTTPLPTNTPTTRWRKCDSPKRTSATPSSTTGTSPFTTFLPRPTTTS